MAARRLVIVMLVLLGISTLAAALVEAPEEAEEEEPTAAAPAPAPQQAGELVRRRIDADARSPALIRIAVGDQLVLTVTSSRADQVEIPAIGELRFVAPLAPARFDLLAREEGAYTVRLVDADRPIGRIEAGRPPGSQGTRED